MMKNTVWQDEKDFILEILKFLSICRTMVYMVRQSLLSSTKKMSKKFTVSTSISWHGLIKPFIRAKEWPLSSPDVNPLHYFYWNFVRTKVDESRCGKPVASEAELKKTNLLAISQRITWYR